MRRKSVDCRAKPGDSCVYQHRPVTADIRVSCMRRRKVLGRKKLKTWRLKDKAVRQEFVNALEKKFQSGNVEWAEFQNNITQICKDLCGVTTGAAVEDGRGRQGGGTSDKKEAFKTW